MGQPGRAVEGEDARLEALKAEIDNAHDGWNTCWSRSDPDRLCRMGVPGKAPDFIVWGDSMANSAWPGFDGYAAARGQAGVLATEPACAPLVGVAPKQSCIAHNRRIMDFLQEAPAMDVFLMARWPYYAEGYGQSGAGRAGQVPLQYADGRMAAENMPAFRQGLDATLARLPARHRLVVVGVVPEYPFSVPKAMLRALRFGTAPAPQTLADFEARNGRTAAALRAAADRHGARLVEPHRVLCASGICAYQNEGKPLFFDNVHLGPHGNRILQRMLLDAMDARETSQ